MVSFPPCKINLGLNIIRKRSDGYHDIETCFYPVPWTDILEIIVSDQVTFASTGLTIPGNTDDNLCLKAYYLIKKDFDIAPVKIHLHKIIPTGAGLGGGSSDAAFTLRMLNEIFKLNLSTTQLLSYASQLGSDCAFFIQDKPMLGEGRGEILSEIDVDLKGKFLVIVKPDVHVSTANAYAGVKPEVPSVRLKNVLEKRTHEWRRSLKNDFEESVFIRYPEIKEIKEKLYSEDALYASMSGSGSAVFGIFEKNPQSIKLKEGLDIKTYNCLL
ncbi:MAG TPA: 4-(cytidine 5'-diphospho)-2-C-methyl-D-erythritol kinase [Cyclobacteriaceae bacterium]|jgi:4-diphosphocytidyl-2-C-methyl-D-erythritol kinase|nr:4-(cytidine 5'-diphospho)-2-C-methyl-D-erythritol kinase [Cyclobacteriaceae bacterium]